MSKSRLAVALSIFTLINIVWAVSLSGTAHRRVLNSNSAVQPVNGSVAPIRFREDRRGLLVDAWINNSGPYTVALDTGAGTSIITSAVVQRARLQVQRSKVPLRGGISSTPIQSNREAPLNALAIGFESNRITTTVMAAVVETLPGSIDGILDPTQIFGALPYSVDFQKQELGSLVEIPEFHKDWER